MGNVQNKNRIAWVDAAKGIAIIFVLIIHYDRSDAGRVAALGLMFSVQMFFFLSGMFANTAKYTIKEYIKRQAKALMLPYAVFSVINIVFHYIFNRGLPSEVIREIVINIILARRNHMLVAAMWFLPCLFLVSILYKLLAMAIRDKRLLLAVCFGISAFARFLLQEPMLVFSANQALRFIVYYSAGDVLYPYLKDMSMESFKAAAPKKKMFTAMTMVLLAVLVCRLYIKDYIIRISYEYNFAFITSLFVNTVVIIVFVIMLSVLISGFVPLVKIGQNTLGFCCLENIGRAVVNTAMALTGIGFWADDPLEVVLFNFIAMAASYVIIVAINRFCPVLFGKSKAKK